MTITCNSNTKDAMALREGPEDRKQALLDSKPKRDSFESDEEYGEAYGYWMSHQGRILAMTAPSKVYQQGVSSMKTNTETSREPTDEQLRTLLAEAELRRQSNLGKQARLLQALTSNAEKEESTDSSHREDKTKD